MQEIQTTEFIHSLQGVAQVIQILLIPLSK